MLPFFSGRRSRVAAHASLALLVIIVVGVLVSACGDEEDVQRFQLKTPAPTATPFGAEVMAYVSVQNSRARIREINRFGSGVFDLSLRTTPSNGQPAWSPDGARVAFTSARDGAGDIFVMDSNGVNQVRLTVDEAPEGFPAWSPDGERVAFSSRREGNGDIYSVSVDGSAEQRLTDDPEADTAPAWSPDGSRIVFESMRDGNTEIYVMNSDGSP
jgi:Tol biopolymer transport system component